MSCRDGSHSSSPAFAVARERRPVPSALPAAVDEDEDEEGDEGEEEGGKRGITYEVGRMLGIPPLKPLSMRLQLVQMAKNKGMKPARKKEQRNPRVKHRRKFRDALVRLFLSSRFLLESREESPLWRRCVSGPGCQT